MPSGSRSRLVVLALIAALGGVVSAQAPQPADRAILDELRQIRQLLERLTRAAEPAPAPEVNRRVAIAAPAGYSIGEADAPLTMVEFTDLQCPFCRHFHTTTFVRLKAAYIDTHKLRYFSRDYPLESLHPLAITAARAARCAGEQGNFWEMRHAILKDNSALTEELLRDQAALLKLDRPRFANCLDDSRMFQQEIQQDMAEADRVGVTGTPSIGLGRVLGNTLQGILVVGAQPYETFDAQLRGLLTVAN